MAWVRNNIAAMKGYVPGEQPSDAGIIKLNTNENPYPPSPRVMEAIRAVTPDRLRRYPDPEANVFRQAAAKVHGISPEMIMATNGGDELLALLFRACVGEGDRVAFLDPAYSLYPVLSAMQAARPVALPYEINGGDWRLPEDIFKLNAKLLLIVNPNAPSGTLIDRDMLARVIGGFPGAVLIDEAYVDFAPTSALELVGQFANLILLRSLSKGYSLAGMRFGYGIARESFLRELYKVRDSYPCDAVAIAAARAAIEDQAYARGTWEKVLQERRCVTERLRNMGFVVPRSHANFVLAQTPAGIDAERLYQRLKDRNILVRYFPQPRLADKLRITIGTPVQNGALLEAIGELAKEMLFRPHKDSA